jgi:hypothetical protein
MDLFMDRGMPDTLADDLDQFSDDIEDPGAWLAEARRTSGVPTYVDEIDSIADLPGNADTFDGSTVRHPRRPPRRSGCSRSRRRARGRPQVARGEPRRRAAVVEVTGLER